MTRRNKVHTLSDRIQDRSERLVEEVRELGHIAANATGDALRRARRRGEEGFDHGRERLRHGADEVGELIGGNPWRAVAIALGAGLLLGLMCRNGRR